MNNETKDELLILIASPNSKEFSYDFVAIGNHAEDIKKSSFGMDLYAFFTETFDKLQLQSNFSIYSTGKFFGYNFFFRSF